MRGIDVVISWILNSVSCEIVDNFLYIDTTYEIWEDLLDRFHKSNGPRIFQIKKELVVLHQGALDASSYYIRLKIILDELKLYHPVPACHCGGMRSWTDYQNQEYVM